MADPRVMITAQIADLSFPANKTEGTIVPLAGCPDRRRPEFLLRTPAPFRDSSTRYHLWGTCISPEYTTPDFKQTGLLGACIEGTSGGLQSFFAKLLLFVMLFAGTFLKSFSFPMNVYERVYILLAFHALTPGMDSTLPDKRIGSSVRRSHVLLLMKISPGEPSSYTPNREISLMDGNRKMMSDDSSHLVSPGTTGAQLPSSNHLSSPPRIRILPRPAVAWLCFHRS